MITRVNPDTLHHNPAFTQAVIIESSSKQVYVGGQNAVNAAGEIVGHDIASQTTQAMTNLVNALNACGAQLSDVFKMTIYIVAGQSLGEAYAASQQLQALAEHPPTISVLFVAGLANPEFLIEIDAIAAIQ